MAFELYFPTIESTQLEKMDAAELSELAGAFQEHLLQVAGQIVRNSDLPYGFIIKRAVDNFGKVSELHGHGEDRMKRKLLSALEDLSSDRLVLEDRIEQNPLLSFDERFHKEENNLLTELIDIGRLNGIDINDLIENPITEYVYDFISRTPDNFDDKRIVKLIDLVRDNLDNSDLDLVLRKLKIVASIRDGIHMLHQHRLMDHLKDNNILPSIPSEGEVFFSANLKKKAIEKKKGRKLDAQQKIVDLKKYNTNDDRDYIIRLLGINKDKKEAFIKACDFNSYKTNPIEINNRFESRFITEIPGLHLLVNISKHDDPDTYKRVGFHQISLFIGYSAAYNTIMAPVNYPENNTNLISRLIVEREDSREKRPNS